MSDGIKAREIPLGPGRATEFTLSPDPKPADSKKASALRRWWQQIGPSKPRR